MVKWQDAEEVGGEVLYDGPWLKDNIGVRPNRRRGSAPRSSILTPCFLLRSSPKRNINQLSITLIITCVFQSIQILKLVIWRTSPIKPLTGKRGESQLEAFRIPCRAAV